MHSTLSTSSELVKNEDVVKDEDIYKNECFDVDQMLGTEADNVETVKGDIKLGEFIVLHELNNNLLKKPFYKSKTKQIYYMLFSNTLVYSSRTLSEEWTAFLRA